jgi:hypothetical protein
MILLHQTHEFKGFWPDFLLNALGVVFWPVQLFVWWQMRVLRYILAFIAI